MTRRGRSHSKRPVSKRAPSWCRYSPEEVEAFVVKLGKEGLTPSKIGVTLRDQYGVPLVKSMTGKSITQILEQAGLKPTIPETLNNLLEKAANLRQHLARNKADAANRRSLELVVSKIRRLGRYYKGKGELPSNWEYRP
ncbi:MAG: 30S ribosomal protein S15 [Candidatus Bathyarchaeia archaeon]